MKKRIVRNGILTILIAMMMLGMTACGSKKSHTNIDLGIESVKNTDYVTALTYFDAAKERGEDEMLLYRGYGLAYMGQSKYEDAIASFEKALSYSDGILSDYEYDINNYLAAAYFRVGEYDKAMDDYSAIIALRPKEKTTYYLRGTAELAKGMYDDAITDFDYCISLNKEDYSTYLDIYVCLKEYGYEEKGIDYLKGVMEKETSTMSSYDKGRVCFYLGDYSNSCVYLEQAYQTNNSEEVMLMLGRAYEADGNLNYAATLFTKYLQSNISSALVYNELGLLKLKQQDYAGALDAFQSAMLIPDQDMTQALKMNEIITYEYLGDYRRATVLLENYLVSYPDDADAIREYEFLKTR